LKASSLSKLPCDREITTVIEPWQCAAADAGIRRRARVHETISSGHAAPHDARCRGAWERRGPDRSEVESTRNTVLAADVP